MPLFYGSVGEGLAFLESVVPDDGYFKAVYVAHGGKLTAPDETPAAEDDSTT